MEVIGRVTQRPGLRLVAIDGLPLAGKSTLADRVAVAPGAQCIHLDDFVKPEAEWRSHDQPSFPFDFIALGQCGILLRLDPQLLDDRPPFCGIRLHQPVKRLRCLSVARENLLPEIGELRSYGCIGQCPHNRRIEFGDDVSWRAFGRKKPPQAEKENEGSPISAKVGMSGASTERVSLVTAYAFTLPARTSGNCCDMAKARSI